MLTPLRRTSLTAIAAPGPILRGPIGDLFNVTLIYDDGSVAESRSNCSGRVTTVGLKKSVGGRQRDHALDVEELRP